MSFPPSAACKFLDLHPVNLRNLHLHLTKNPFASRPPHLYGVTLIHNENEHIFRNIDEAGLKQAETDRLVKLKELELEEKRLGQQSNLRKILTVIWLVLSLLILGVVIVRWTADASGFGTAFLMLFYLGGPVIGGGAYLIFHVLPEKEEERRLSKSGGIRFPSGLTPFSDKQYTVIEEALLSAGFKNVRSVNLHDLNVFTALVNNGTSVFCAGVARLPKPRLAIFLGSHSPHATAGLLPADLLLPLSAVSLGDQCCRGRAVRRQGLPTLPPDRFAPMI